MKRLLAFSLAMPLAAALSACAGRIADPIEVVQAQDMEQPCLSLDGELEGNEDKVAFLQERQDTADARNLGIGTLGFVFLTPIYLALDVSDANEREIAALEERRERLHALRAAKGCHLKKVAPESYQVYVRERRTYTDSYGRLVEVPVNTYSNSPKAAQRIAARKD